VGIFQRFEDDVPSIFVALFVAFLVAMIVLPLSLFIFNVLIPVLPPLFRGCLCVLVTLSAAGATCVITLAKLRKT
jgi:hypothetical protein